MPNATVLVAEDEYVARTALGALLEANKFTVLTAADGTTALSTILREEPDAVLLDIRMPGLDGLSVLRQSLRGGSDSPVIVMTAHGDSGTAIEAMKLGAFDYLVKPIDFDHVLHQVTRAIEHRRASRKLQTSAASGDLPASVAMIGHSPSMQRVYKLIGQVAGSNATVLVRGESGTGKELVVNAIHENSPRADKPLVKINCASIPDTLLESELFGHEKGAFTNAIGRRLGRFEEASEGTLFLDEIAELAPSLQAKLLRAIQEHTIERLGSNVSIQVDVRLIAATSRNLEQGLADGHFREDLYYRLNVVTIALPPLRDRKGDIPALVQHFLRRSHPPASITADALAMLCDYHWPGNIRELENTVARALVLAHGSLVEKSNILLLSDGPAETSINWTDLIPLDRTWKDNIETMEKALLTRALIRAGGNKSRAAELLGIQRRLLYEKLRQYKVGVNP